MFCSVLKVSSRSCYDSTFCLEMAIYHSNVVDGIKRGKSGSRQISNKALVIIQMQMEGPHPEFW